MRAPTILGSFGSSVHTCDTQNSINLFVRAFNRFSFQFFKMAPPKKKVVKHLKKSWKKHSDIQDVEDYLEDKRLQERTGGLVAEKKDDQLFFLDSAPVEGDKTTLKTASTNLGGKKRKIHEPARCYANLQPDARVPVPNTDQKGELGKKKKRIIPAGKRRDDLQ